VKIFDAIVIGVGGMGSAALYQLARRGLNVLGIEQFHIGHDRGSSHGQTRIIRKAYFEHPDYVPLLHRAYEQWHELEREVGRELFCRTGLLLIGPPEGPIVAGVKRAARQHGLDIQSLSRREMDARFPVFRFDRDDEALFEFNAGFLRVEACVEAFAAQAMAHGATILTETAVESWSADGDIRVRTSKGEFAAKSLVICAGPWAGKILADLKLPLEVRRKVVCWFDTVDPRYDVQHSCPVFGFDTAAGFIYGFPVIDHRGLKLANHSGGKLVFRPEEMDRELHPNDVMPLQRFLENHLPCVRSVVKEHSVCMYTMTPDEHFIIDRHPGHSNVFFAAGFSGHGFKFVPIVGSVLADLVIDGGTKEPIAFLSVSRSALR
jgi:sarcosine oxidase